MTRKIIRILILVTMLGSASAQAQISYSVFPLGFRLLDKDVEAIDNAEIRLLARKKITAGATEAWKGQGTGNSGKVTILRVFEKQGLPCLETAYDFKFERINSPNPRAVHHVCRLPANWE